MNPTLANHENSRTDLIREMETINRDANLNLVKRVNK